MNPKPIVGLEEIHRRYFITDDGQEIMTMRTLRGLSKEMQDAGAVARVTMRINGKKKVRLVALEPFFSLWRRQKLCIKPKKHEIRGFMGKLLSTAD